MLRRARQRLTRTVVTAVAALCLAGMADIAQAQVVASVWYRGLPSGVPRAVDLEAIKNAGFDAVTWPLQHVSGAEELQRIAGRVGLTVVIRSESEPLSFGSVSRGEAKVDLWIQRTPRAEWSALFWRAVAHGARVVSFDAGLAEGTGLWDENGGRDWVPVAAALARQLRSAAGLVGTLRRGPALALSETVPDLDVSLLENTRSWVLIATNASTTGGRVLETYATFPAEVPAAEWLNLFDGSMMSMLYRPAGSRWHVRLGPGEAKVFVIDKR